MLFDFFLIWVIVSFVSYTPLVCYLDLKYRDIPHKTWWFLIITNIPGFLILLYNGTYQWWTLLLSTIGVIFWFLAMRFGVINGADFVFLALISIFLVFNPLSGHLMYLPFMIFLTLWMAITIWYLFAKSIRDDLRNGKRNIKDIIMTASYNTKNTNKLPLMIPISLALICAVILG